MRISVALVLIAMGAIVGATAMCLYSKVSRGTEPAAKRAVIPTSAPAATSAISATPTPTNTPEIVPIPTAVPTRIPAAARCVGCYIRPDFSAGV